MQRSGRQQLYTLISDRSVRQQPCAPFQERFTPIPGEEAHGIFIPGQSGDQYQHFLVLGAVRAGKGKSFLQHFRDADADGLIGAKGYFGFMTDLASEQLHFEGKGNDTLPEKDGAAWIYTKCRLQDCIPIGFEEEVHAECRISRVDKARLW